MSEQPCFSHRDGVMHAEDVALPDLAEHYGTPSYIYSATGIVDRITQLRDALGPDVLMAYACKANSNGAILSLMAVNGMGADVVSGGELKRAMLAGIPANKIVFSGVGKTDEELMLAIQLNIYQINIESAAELERLIDLRPEKPVRVAFRLNPDVDANTHAKISTGHGDSKFGMPADEIEGLYARIDDHANIRPIGLSMHIGSQLTTLDPFRIAFTKLATLASKMPKIETIDFGGGLGIIYDDEQAVDLKGYAALVNDILVPLGKKLITEPGRFLVAGSGILLTRILYIKKTMGRPMIILDTGMNDLMRPALYDAVHKAIPVTESPKPERDFDIAGPICESSDMFAVAATMAEPQHGDLIALMNAGAYGFSMAGNYNSRTLPAEILVHGKKHASIRNRQSFEDLMRDETVPDWVKGAA